MKNKPTFRDNILLFSDLGGGGAWLAEKLKSLPGTAMLWEPLHKDAGVVDPNLNFGWTPYIPRDLMWEEAKKDLLDIISGSKLNQWIVSRTRVRDFVHAQRLLVKFVHGNALLPWLVNRISLPVKPIFLVRHPITTSLFQMRSRNKQYDRKDILDCNQVEFSEYWLQHTEFIKSLTSELEFHVALWCLHNQPALQAENKDKYLTVRFEDIVLYGRHELYRLYQDLGFDPTDKNLLSQMNSLDPLDLVRSEPENILSLDTWLHQISEQEKERTQRILDHFSIEEYSAFSPYPKAKPEFPKSNEERVSTIPSSTTYAIDLNPV
ncbi:MAG: hypothetical protein AAF694_27755 [Bacteroidota bacterium]